MFRAGLEGSTERTQEGAVGSELGPRGPAGRRRRAPRPGPGQGARQDVDGERRGPAPAGHRPPRTPARPGPPLVPVPALGHPATSAFWPPCACDGGQNADLDAGGRPLRRTRCRRAPGTRDPGRMAASREVPVPDGSATRARASYGRGQGRREVRGGPLRGAPAAAPRRSGFVEARAYVGNRPHSDVNVPLDARQRRHRDSGRESNLPARSQQLHPDHRHAAALPTPDAAATPLLMLRDSLPTRHRGARSRR